MLTAAFPEMEGWPLPSMLLGLCLRAWKRRREGSANLQSVEYFAGSGNLTKEFLRAHQQSVALDKAYSPHHDFATPCGLWLALDAMCSTAPGASTWFGAQCSSFVVLCHHQSQRLPQNNYWGDQSRAFVNDGNHLMDVTSLLFLLSYLLCNVATLEQPAGSVLPKVSTMAQVLDFTLATRTVTYGGCFGTSTRKPWVLWSTSEAVASLSRKCPDLGPWSNLVHRHENSAQFTGIKDALQASECYPPAFGRALRLLRLLRS